MNKGAVPPWVPSASIRHVVVDDRVVVLDVRRGQYLILDEIASELWNLIVCETDPTQRLDELANRFEIPRSRSRSEFDHFIATCSEQGLLCRPIEQPTARPAHSLGVRTPTTFGAWKSIYATRKRLGQRGFPAVYEWHRQLNKPQPFGTHREGLVDTALRAFSRAENLFSTRAARTDCLPRSFALHRFLASVGVNADHCLGVRRFPFGAHAWVEINGSVVCDSEAFVSQFSEISRT